MSGESCVFTPSRGKTLYRGLTSKLGHKKGTEIFLRSINPKFIEDFNKSLTLDNEGIPLLDSLMKNPIIQSFIGVTDFAKYLESSLQNNTFENNEDGWNKAVATANNYNVQSEFRDTYIVIPEKTNEGISLKVTVRDDESEILFSSIQKTTLYEKQVMPVFDNVGIKRNAVTQIFEALGKDMYNPNDWSDVVTVITDLARAFNEDKTDIDNLENLGQVLYILFSDSPFLGRILNTIKIDNPDLSDTEYESMTGDRIIQALKGEDTDDMPIINRTIGMIKSFFANLNSEELINISDRITGKELDFMKNLKESPQVENIDSIENEGLSNLEEKLKKITEYVKDLRLLEIKRLKLSPTLGAVKALAKADAYAALAGYIEESTEQLKVNLEKLRNIDSLSLREQWRITKDFLDYVTSYGLIISKIYKDILNKNSELGELIGTEEELDVLRRNIETMSGINNMLFGEAKQRGEKFFNDFIEPLIGRNIKILISGDEKREATIEEIMNDSDTDISLFSRLLDSAANSPDIILQAVHKGIKKEKDAVRTRVIEVAQKAIAMGKRAEKAGLKDFTFMYETDTEGNRTGKYISYYDWAAYKQAKDDFFELINQKYKGQRGRRNYKKKEKEIKNWYKENSTLTADGRIPKDIPQYQSQAYQNMTDAQRTFYKEFMQIKEELDELLPPGTTFSNNSIKIRKNVMERLSTNLSNPKEFFRGLGETMADSILERSDDTEFGDRSRTNLEGKVIHTVPIYYVKSKKGENMNSLTDDLVGALISYSFMAHNYHAMNKISNVLELGREVMHNRNINEHIGDRTVHEVVKGLGMEKKIPVKKENTNIENLYNDLLETQIYNMYWKKTGSTEIAGKQVSHQKLASLGLRISSSIHLGLNVLAGIASGVNGVIMQNTEAVAGQFYKVSSLAKADAYYIKHLPKFLSELESREKTNELDLIYEYFNIEQNFDKQIKNVNFNRRGFLRRFFGKNILYLCQTCGDHFLYGRSGLAMLLEKKVIDAKGKETSLLKALRFVDVDPENPEFGRKISVEGIKNLDGTAFSEEDKFQISREIEYVNSKCFGVYDNENIVAARRVMAGRALLQYRDWMRPALKRRFAKKHKNVLLDKEEEGYYTTGIRLTWGIIKELTHGKVAIAQTWKNLTDYEKQNLARIVAEVSQFGAILGTLRMIDWDLSDDNYAMQLLEYTLRRQVTEIGALVPSPYMISEGLKLLESPMAYINILDNSVNLYKLLIPSNYEDELESGPYKGHSTAYKTLMNSPLVLQYKNIRRIINPAEGIPFLKQGQK